MRYLPVLCLVGVSFIQALDNPFRPRRLTSASAPAPSFEVNVNPHGARGGSICVAGSDNERETPKVQVCNCDRDSSCESYAVMQFLSLAAGKLQWPQAGTFTDVPVTSGMWPSKRFHLSREREYTIISNGIGVGTIASGAFAGMTGYVSNSPFQLSTNDFISSTPATAFMTSEVSRIGICIIADPSDPDVVFRNESDEELFEDVNGTEIFKAPTELPLCGKAQSVGPGRLKFSLYGYTWGKNWEADVSGQQYLFFRVRLCFNAISRWLINGKEKGDGILDTDTQVTAIDVQQDDGRPFAVWLPRLYMAGEHLNCTLVDQAWDFPKFECRHAEFNTVRVTASSTGDGTCLQEGIVLNIGLQMLDLGTKDRWFYYGLEVNTSVSSSKTAAGVAIRRHSLSSVTRWLSFLVVLVLLESFT